MLDRAGTQVRFRLLGRVCIETDTGVLAPVRRQERCLLAILLIESGRVVPLPRLCELIWDDKPPLRAHEAVRSQVAHLRALLVRAGAGPGVDLTSDHNGYVLRVPPGAVDAHLFRDLVERAGRTPDLAERERLLREALALWQGPALHNAATERLRQRLCADLEELRAHAIEERLATGLELGRHHELLPELTRLSSEQPVRERLVQLHMLALYRQGRSAEALDVYRRTRDGLADEFGIDPSPTLQLLHRAILRGDPVSTVRPVPGPAPADAAAAVRGSAARPVRWSEVRPVPLSCASGAPSQSRRQSTRR